MVIDNQGVNTHKAWKVLVQRGDYISPPDGDVNFDGALNVLDVVTMMNFIMGLLIPSEEALYESDLSGDGGLNILDVVQAVNILMGDD